LFSCQHTSRGGNQLTRSFCFRRYPGGRSSPGGKACVFASSTLTIGMGKIYEQAFKEKRSGGEDRRAHAWGSLPGGATSSETAKRKVGNTRTRWSTVTNDHSEKYIQGACQCWKRPHATPCIPCAGSRTYVYQR